VKILLDENLDWRLRRDLPGHTVESVPSYRLGGTQEQRAAHRGGEELRSVAYDGQQHGASTEPFPIPHRGNRIERPQQSFG